jgi:host factor-I protein
MSGKVSVQDAYLKETAEKAEVVRVNLVNGKEVRGVIKAFDAFTVLLTIKGMDILVYKSAIAAMGPASAPE